MSANVTGSTRATRLASAFAQTGPCGALRSGCRITNRPTSNGSAASHGGLSPDPERNPQNTVDVWHLNGMRDSRRMMPPVGRCVPHSPAVPRRAPVTLASAPSSLWPNSPALSSSNRGPVSAAARVSDHESAPAKGLRSNEARIDQACPSILHLSPPLNPRPIRRSGASAPSSSSKGRSRTRLSRSGNPGPGGQHPPERLHDDARSQQSAATADSLTSA